MATYEKKLEIRWSDLDPHFHLRHSVYYDYGAFSRLSFMNENGITPAILKQYHIGPIVFREECLFKREIFFGDVLMINLKLEKATEDMSRWTMVHELWKNEVVLAAIITVDGAWLDTRIRKLAKIPDIFRFALERIPRTDHFQFTTER
jgi:acyl-CoA thioester hydrolase